MKRIIIIRIYLSSLTITNNDCNITYNKMEKSHKLHKKTVSNGYNR